MQVTDVIVLDYNWTIICVFGVLFPLIQPKFNPLYVLSVDQCNQLKNNGQSVVNFVLAESSSSKNECFLFHCIFKCIHCDTNVHFMTLIDCDSLLHLIFPSPTSKIYPCWSCLMLAKNKTWYQRVRCYLIFISIINRTMHFKMADSFYLKNISHCSRFQKLNISIRLIKKHFLRKEDWLSKIKENDLWMLNFLWPIVIHSEIEKSLTQGFYLEKAKYFGLWGESMITPHYRLKQIVEIWKFQWSNKKQCTANRRYAIYISKHGVI